MKIYTDAAQAAPTIAERIAAADRILILTHINPDGDAIGSLLAVWHALHALGKQVLPLASSPLPGYAQWLPGVEHIRVYEPGMPFPDVELAILVDTASLERVGRIYHDHQSALAALPLIIVDHHVTNDGPGSVNLIMSTAAATCELLHALFVAMGVSISADIATCLLLGLATDTQSFQTNSTTAQSLRTAAELLDAGADHIRVVHEVHYALPVQTILLIGMALAAMRHHGVLAWTTITLAMMETTGAEDEAIDEVVRLMQRIAGIQALVMFKERYDGTTKISLRAKPPIDVATLARVWGGGGHSQAAGATLLMPPEQAEREVIPRLRALAESADKHDSA